GTGSVLGDIRSVHVRRGYNGQMVRCTLGGAYSIGYGDVIVTAVRNANVYQRQGRAVAAGGRASLEPVVVQRLGTPGYHAPRREVRAGEDGAADSRKIFGDCWHLNDGYRGHAAGGCAV